MKAGDRLGPYEILAPIGEGGMGEVYRARHAPRSHRRHQGGEGAVLRALRGEARAVAALNHPHICTLHDVGPNYLVMEYIEGHPLTGPLPLEQALRFAVQICDALDAAHRNRHRRGASDGVSHPLLAESRRHQVPGEHPERRRASDVDHGRAELDGGVGEVTLTCMCRGG